MPHSDIEKRREASRRSMQRKRGVNTDEGLTSPSVENGVNTIEIEITNTDIPKDITPREASWLVSHKDMVISKHRQLDLIYRSLKEKGLTEEVRIGDLDMGEIGILLGKV